MNKVVGTIIKVVVGLAVVGAVTNGLEKRKEKKKVIVIKNNYSETEA
jgi:hypothetical protein